MKTSLCLTLLCLLGAVHGKSISIDEQKLGCVSCITTINNLKENFAKVDGNEAYANVEKLCDQKGDLSSICNDIDADSFKTFYSRAKDLNSTTVCYVMEECVDEVVDAAFEVINNRPPSFDNPCDMCNKVLKMVPDEVTQDSMQTALKAGCEGPETFKTKCEKNVDRIFPLIYEKFFDGLYNFRPLCTFLGYCPGPGLFQPAPAVQPVPSPAPTSAPVRTPATTRAPDFSLPRPIYGPSFSLPSFNLNPGFNHGFDESLGVAAGGAGLLGVLGALGAGAGALLPAFAFG